MASLKVIQPTILTSTPSTESSCGEWHVPTKDTPASLPTSHPPAVVCVRYCDGGSWTGARTDPVMVNGTALWFRGRANIDAQFDDLSTQFGFNKATEVGASRLSPPPPPLALSYTAPSSHTHRCCLVVDLLGLLPPTCMQTMWPTTGSQPQ